MIARKLPAKAKIIKARKCKAPGCVDEFFPSKPMQKVCSWECSAVLAKAKREKEAATAARLERKETKAKLEKFKRRADYLKDAQTAFNRFIRLRDQGKPCICCAKPLPVDAVGGAYDCGHYRSVGSAPHMRFDERNAHGQLKQCNRWGAGRAVDYRLGLIARIGLSEVESIESDQQDRKYSIDELKALKALYVAKAKELKRGQD